MEWKENECNNIAVTTLPLIRKMFGDQTCSWSYYRHIEPITDQHRYSILCIKFYTVMHNTQYRNVIASPQRREESGQIAIPALTSRYLASSRSVCSPRAWISRGASLSMNCYPAGTAQSLRLGGAEPLWRCVYVELKTARRWWEGMTIWCRGDKCASTTNKKAT